MTRKKAHEEHVNHERWLVSYADFITLLFAFFTVLYATAQTDQEKLQAVVNGLNAAFEGGMPIAVFSDAAMGTAAVGLDETHVTLVSDTQSLVVSMKRGLQGSLSDNVVQVGLVDQELTVVLPARLAFATGSADLHPSAFNVLTEVARVLGDAPATIEVVGHADAIPVPADSPFVDNWGLASARALAAVRFLQKRGIPSDHLIASCEISTETDSEDRAVTLRIHADSPSLGGDLSDGLNKAGLLPDAE